jgi:hypothetical protein
MKHFIALVVVVLFTMSLVLPLYAVEISPRNAKGDVSYAEKIRENNKKIATFVADTVKLPGVVVGDFTGHEHEKSVNGMKYEKHEYLQKLPERLRGEGKAVK